MWRWPLVPLILLLLPLKPNFLYSSSTSTGPTSDQEAEFLWKEGQNAIQELRFQDASLTLQRLIDRYPSKKGYLKAHLLLGKSFIRLGKAKEAVPLLQNFILSTPSKREAAYAQIELGHAYIELKKWNEAYLTTLEMNHLASQTELPSDFLLGSLLVKVQSLLGLHHPLRATQALESTEKQITDKNSAEVRGQASVLKLHLKILNCAQLPIPGPLDEAQIMDQLDRKGTCLQEALLLFQKTLQTGDLLSATTTASQLNENFDSYIHQCSHPPHPPETPQKKKKFKRNGSLSNRTHRPPHARL